MTPTWFLSHFYHLALCRFIIGISRPSCVVFAANFSKREKVHFLNGTVIFKVFSTVRRYLQNQIQLGDDDTALGSHLGSVENHHQTIKTGPRFVPQNVLVQCRRLQDLVLQGTTKSTRNKSQKHETALKSENRFSVRCLNLTKFMLKVAES